jgi:hypothetical protein
MVGLLYLIHVVVSNRIWSSYLWVLSYMGVGAVPRRSAEGRE